MQHVQIFDLLLVGCRKEGHRGLPALTLSIAGLLSLLALNVFLRLSQPS